MRIGLFELARVTLVDNFAHLRVHLHQTRHLRRNLHAQPA